MKQKYLLLLLFVIVAGFFFHYLSSLTIDAKNKKIYRLDKKIKKQQEKLNSAKVLNEQLKEVSKVIHNTIVDEKKQSAKEVNDFVKQLADLANDYKIAVNSLLPKTTFNLGTYLKQEYIMELTCTYVQMGKLLSSLESTDKIIRIKTLDVNPIQKNLEAEDGDNINETRYRVTIELVTFKIVKEA